MSMLRIQDVVALEGFRLRLTLTDGTVIDRDVSALLTGIAFEAVQTDIDMFKAVRVESGFVVWPNGGDLCPDVLIWGGIPPEEQETTPEPFATLG